MAIGLTYTPVGPGEPPRSYGSWHALAGFGVLLGTNLASLLVIVTRGDLVWCAAATWVTVSVWTAQPKPAPVYVRVRSPTDTLISNSHVGQITALTFTVLHPIAFVTSLVWRRFCSPSRQNRAIVLPGDEADHPALYGSTQTNGGTGTGARAAELERGPREVEDETWG